MNNSESNLQNNTDIRNNRSKDVIVSNHNEYVYIFMVIIGLILIIYGIKLHFDMYDSKYVSVRATITDIDCNRVILNRRRDIYNCTIEIEYTFDDKIISNTI